jgi:hypothetical protein
VRASLLTALSLAVACGLAHASVSSGSLPAAIEAQAGPLQPVGQGRLRFFGLNVYDAALWAPAGFRASQFGELPLVLELHYLRGFSDTEIARASLDQMKRHGRIDDSQAQRWKSQLIEALPNVRKGDRLAGLHRPGQGVVFFHQGQPVGEVADPEFARLFFAIWLGEATSVPELRRALLAGAAR